MPTSNSKDEQTIVTPEPTYYKKNDVKSKIRLTSNYLNPYERTRLDYKDYNLYDDNLWNKFVRGDYDNSQYGTLDMYIDALDKTKDISNFSEMYKNLDYGKYETKLAALYNEAYADKNNIDAERERYVTVSKPNHGDEGHSDTLYYVYKDGTEVPVTSQNIDFTKLKTEKYNQDDYHYYKNLINQSLEQDFQEHLYQVEKERKDSMSGFEKSLGAIGSEFLYGITNTIDNLSSFFTAVVNSIGSDNFADSVVESIGTDDGRILQGLEDAILEYESRYTYMRDLDGNYTNVGKYIGGVTYSLGQMFPSMLISLLPGIGPASGASSKVAGTIASGASQLVFYTSMASGNVRDIYQASASQNISVASERILANAAIKAGLQWAEEYALGKVLGNSALDNLVFGRSIKNVSSKSLTKAGLKRLGQDFVKEGLEEVVQDTSDFLVDKAYGRIIGDNSFSELGISDISAQSLADSFIIGGLASLSGSAARLVGISVKQLIPKTAITTADIKFNKKGDANFKRVNPIAAWEYGLSMQSLAKNFDSIRKQVDKYTKLKNSGFDKDLRRNEKQIIDAYTQIYATVRMLSSMYTEIGKERFENANKILEIIDKNIEQGKFIEGAVTKFTETLQSAMLLGDVNYSKDIAKAIALGETYKKIEQAELDDIVGTFRKGDNITIDDPETKARIQKLTEENPDKTVIVTKSGRDIVIDDTGKYAFVPLPYLMNAGNGTVNATIAEQTLVNNVIKSKYGKIVIDKFKDAYKKYSGKDGSTEEVVYNILFNKDFQRIMLATANIDTYKFLSSLYDEMNETKVTSVEEAVYKKKIKIACDGLIEVFTDYFSNNTDTSYKTLAFLPKDVKDNIAKRQWCKNLYARVIAGEKLTDYDWNVLNGRINALPIDDKSKEIIRNNLKSDNPSVRESAMRSIAMAHKAIFMSDYDGKTYMPYNSLPNMVFNNYLKRLGINISNMFDVITEEDTRYIIQSYGEVNRENIVRYRKLQFSKSCNNSYSFTVSDAGNIEIRDTRTGEVGGYSAYFVTPTSKPGSIIANGKTVVSKNKKTAIDIKENDAIMITSLLSDKVDSVDVPFININDIIVDPELLNDDIRNKIEVQYKNDGGLTPRNTFLFLRKYLITQGSHDTTVIVLQDGSFVLGSIRNMTSSLVDNYDKIDLNHCDGQSISKIIKKEYLKGRLEDCKIEISDINNVAEYRNSKIVTINGKQILVPDNKIVISRKAIQENKDLVRFAILHEFQHAVQTENAMNLGFDSQWISKIPSTLKKAIIADIKLHYPKLFENVKKENEEKVVNTLVYKLTGEVMANGLETSNIVNFMPIVVNYSFEEGLVIKMPWGNSYKLSNTPSRVVSNKEQTTNVVNKVVKDHYSSYTKLQAYKKRRDDNKDADNSKKLEQIKTLRTELMKNNAYFNFSVDVHSDSSVFELIRECNKNPELSKKSIEYWYNSLGFDISYEEFLELDIPVCIIKNSDNLNDTLYVSATEDVSKAAVSIASYNKSTGVKMAKQYYISVGTVKPKDVIVFTGGFDNGVIVKKDGIKNLNTGTCKVASTGRLMKVENLPNSYDDSNKTFTISMMEEVDEETAIKATKLEIGSTETQPKAKKYFGFNDTAKLADIENISIFPRRTYLYSDIINNEKYPVFKFTFDEGVDFSKSPAATMTNEEISTKIFELRNNLSKSLKFGSLNKGELRVSAANENVFLQLLYYANCPNLTYEEFLKTDIPFMRVQSQDITFDTPYQSTLVGRSSASEAFSLIFGDKGTNNQVGWLKTKDDVNAINFIRTDNGGIKLSQSKDNVEKYVTDLVEEYNKIASKAGSNPITESEYKQLVEFVKMDYDLYKDTFSNLLGKGSDIHVISGKCKPRNFVSYIGNFLSEGLVDPKDYNKLGAKIYKLNGYSNSKYEKNYDIHPSYSNYIIKELYEIVDAYNNGYLDNSALTRIFTGRSTLSYLNRHIQSIKDKIFKYSNYDKDNVKHYYDNTIDSFVNRFIDQVQIDDADYYYSVDKEGQDVNTVFNGGTIINSMSELCDEITIYNYKNSYDEYYDESIIYEDFLKNYEYKDAAKRLLYYIMNFKGEYVGGFGTFKDVKNITGYGAIFDFDGNADNAYIKLSVDDDFFNNYVELEGVEGVTFVKGNFDVENVEFSDFAEVEAEFFVKSNNIKNLEFINGKDLKDSLSIQDESLNPFSQSLDYTLDNLYNDERIQYYANQDLDNEYIVEDYMHNNNFKSEYSKLSKMPEHKQVYEYSQGIINASDVKVSPDYKHQSLEVAHYRIDPNISFKEFMNKEYSFVRVHRTNIDYDTEQFGAFYGNVNADVIVQLLERGVVKDSEEDGEFTYHTERQNWYEPDHTSLIFGKCKPGEMVTYVQGEYLNQSEAMLPADVIFKGEEYKLGKDEDGFYFLTPNGDIIDSEASGTSLGEFTQSMTDEDTDVQKSYAKTEIKTGKDRQYTKEIVKGKSRRTKGTKIYDEDGKVSDYIYEENRVYLSNKVREQYKVLGKFKQKQMSKDMFNFVTTSNVKNTPKELQKLIVSGKLKRSDIMQWFRSTENMTQEEFDHINNSFFHNDKISSFEELNNFVNNRADYYALRAVLRAMGFGDEILNNTDEHIIEQIKVIIEQGDGKAKKLYDKILATYEETYTQTVEINEGNLRRLFMAHYDGSIDSAAYCSAIAKIAALSRWKVTGDVNSNALTLIDEIANNLKQDASEVFDKLIFGEDRAEKLELILEYASKAEFIKMVNNGLKGSKTEISEEFTKLYEEIEDKLNTLGSKMNDVAIDALFDKYVFGLFKNVDPNTYDRLLNNLYIKAVASSIIDKNVVDDEGIAEKSYERTSDKVYNNIRGMVSTIKKNLSPADKKRFLEDNSDIFDDDLNLKEEAYKDEKDSGRSVYKDAEVLSQLEDRIRQLSKNAQEGVYQSAKSKKYKAIADKRMRDMQSKLAIALQGKSKRETTVITVSDESIYVDASKEIPNILTKLLKVQFEQSAKTKVKFISKDGERHVKTSVKQFFEQNAEILETLDQSDVDEIIDFYKNSNIVPNTNRVRDYETVQLAVITYILDQSKRGNYIVSSEDYTALEERLKGIVSVSAQIVSNWRDAMQLLDPEKIMKQSLAKSTGIEFDEADLSELSDAIESGSSSKIAEAKKKLYENGLKQYKGRKRSFLDKLLKFERMAMLSGPGTWLRNQASNILVKGGNAASEQIGTVIGNLFPSKYHKEGQYKIVGTKVSAEVQTFIKNNVIDNGLLEMIQDGFTKYDERKSDKTEIQDQIVELIAKGVASEIFYNNPYKNETLNKVSKFIYKMLSDNAYIKRDFIKYLGKILVEDKVDITKGLTSDVVKHISQAYVMAAENYMHKPNVMTDIESAIKRKLPNSAYFIYKQIAPFAQASWNWFAEGLNYTPIGLAASIVRFMRLENTIDKMENKRQKGEQVASPRFAEYLAKRNIGKGVIGTVGFIIGALLAGFGIAKIDDEDDKWKLKVGDVYIDITNLFGTQGITIGMAVVGSAKNKDFDVYGVFKQALDYTFMDSTFTDLYNTFRYANSFGDFAANLPFSIASSFVPNMVKTISATNKYKVNYEKGIVGKFEKVLVQAIPSISYALPHYIDPYTGEEQVQFKVWWLTQTVNKLSPVDFSPYNVSDAEIEAITLGINHGQLTGSYKVNGEDVTLRKNEVEKLNKFYGELNKDSLDKLINNKVTYKVTDEKTGKIVELKYSQMTDKQKATAINGIMTKNSSYSKIYMLTQSGEYKYYASQDELVILRKIGCNKNVYLKSGKLDGFVKI